MEQHGGGDEKGTLGNKVERVEVAACSASVKGSGGGMLLLMETPERSFCHRPPTQISDVAVVLLYS